MSIILSTRVSDLEQRLRASARAQFLASLEPQLASVENSAIEAFLAKHDPLPNLSAADTALARFISIGDGCFRDNATGLEYTPTLNPEDSKPYEECLRITEACSLAGGGWSLAETPHELMPLVSYDRFEPATHAELAADTKSGWYWTKKPYKASSSADVWVVAFYYGFVGYGHRYDNGFARGVRRVRVASPGQ